MSKQDRKPRTHLPMRNTAPARFVSYDAKDPDTVTTPIEQLSLLAGDDEGQVRWSVAQNPAAPASLRARLLRSDMNANGGSISNSYRARSIASQEDCPAEVLGVLARDSDPEVRSAVIVHPATPLEVLEAMAADRESVE